jgi:hypothetical protein
MSGSDDARTRRLHLASRRLLERGGLTARAVA